MRFVSLSFLKSKHRSTFLIGKLVDRMAKLKAQGLEPSHITNETMIDTLRVTKAHCYLFLLSSFMEGMNSIEEVIQYANFIYL